MRHRKQREHLRRYQRFGKVRLINKGVAYDRIKKLADVVVKRISPYSKKVTIAGSLRRQRRDPSDIDLVVLPKKNKLDDIKREMHSMGKVVSDGDKFIGAFVKNTKVDLYITNPKSYGASLYFATGPGMANVGRRIWAREKDMKLNRWGVFDRKTGKYLAGRTEKDVFKALGRPYKNPEDRG